MENNNFIYCIGDSHASFFSGRNEMQPVWPEPSKDSIPFLKSFRLGPVLAYNLCKLGTRSGGREKLLKLIEAIPRSGMIMLVFGEIDIRVHLLKQANEKNQPIEEVTKICVERYFSVAKELQAMGFEIILFETMPSTLNGSVVEEDYAAYGTCRERNRVTEIFNSELRRLAQENKIKTISVFDELVDEKGITKMKYFVDKIHLAQKVMPLFISKLVQAGIWENRRLFKSNPLNKLSFRQQFFIFKIYCGFKDIVWGVTKYKQALKVVIYKMMKKIIPGRIMRKYRFIKDFYDFKKRLAGKFPVLWSDRQPRMNDNTELTDFDAHYIYHPAWAARILAGTKPAAHVDISSMLNFSTIASAFVPVKFYDFRPAKIELDNFTSEKIDLNDLAFEGGSIPSLSCMHTVEHIGLGRYGDRIDPEGDLKAMKELIRVLAPGGDLLFVVPVGKPKIAFNAHRIYSAKRIVEIFSSLKLVEFSLVDDSGKFIPDAGLDLADRQNYGCGCFWFKK